MKNELLLPVGNINMLLAAIHNGADAVYMGVPSFNARGRTTDFDLDDLKEMIDLAHLYGVKVNLAFNVLIFQQEIAQVVKLLQDLLPLAPDAFIVQDLGLAYIIRTMAPYQRIHASTQMTITNADAIKLLEDLSIDRFVLGRENSLIEIESIRKNTDKEIEVFVHGALCVAYSGQCFTSESLGGRSANRGQCAQSCRLAYELYVDGQKKEMGEKKYLVSPKDLMGLEDVPKLQSIGVQSFKIEGRLKTPEYVAATAKHYRAILDGEDLNIIQRSNELALTYSRGFYRGWLHGVNHQELVDGTFSSHRGIFLGEIQHVKKNIILLKTTFDLRAGMGLVFAADKDKGSKIFTVKKIPHGYEVELLTKDLGLKKGLKVYANSDEQLDKTLQKSWNLKEEKKKIPVTLIVEGEMHQKMKVTMIDVSGNKVEAESSSLLERASQYALTKTFVLHELLSLGASIYKVDQEKYNLADNLFIHNKELKNIKRDLIEKMNLKRVSSRNSYTIKQPPSPPTYKHLGKTQLNILLRTKEQVEGLIKAKKNNFFQLCEEKIGVIILDFEFGRDYAVSLAQLKDAGFITALATTRVLKPLEYNNLKLLHHLQPDYILVRNLGALQFLKSYSTIPLIGDFSFNITNAYAHHYLLAKGLQSICCSYDLNQEQLLDFIQSSDPSTIEVNIHQYMPEFHMEHCVFAAFLSQGTSFRDCGKPCEKHDVELKDPYGEWHHLKADHECRNTFYKATPQSASFLVPKLQDLHIAALRIEALKEVSADFNAKIKTYLELLSRKITTDEALDILKTHERYGLGLGQLHKKDYYVNRKQSPLA